MSETPKCPKCPYCGDRMKLQIITPELGKETYTVWYQCVVCDSTSPQLEIPADSTYSQIEAKALASVMRRVESENRVLTLEEATGSDEPVWLEAMSRVFIADVCVAPDARMAQIQTIGKASCEYLPLCDYGVLWRCWLRNPTKEEMEGTPWES